MASESVWQPGRGQAQPLGRELELSLLAREWEEAKASRCARFVVIRGAAGVGKSHLVDLFAEVLSRRGVPVLAGASARDGQVSFGVAKGLIRAAFDVVAQSGGSAPRLAALSRTLEPMLGGASAHGSPESGALLEAALELVSLAGRESPLFVLPDLDVADAGSLELVRSLATLASTPQAAPGGLFVVTTRDVAPPRVLSLLAALPGRTLSLVGLDLEGLRSFLGRPEVVQRLHDATAGNPELLGQWLERTAVPADFLLSRLERLPASRRRLLDLLAMAPSALPADRLADALGEPVAHVAGWLDLLVSERLLTVRVVEGRAAWRLARDADRRAVLTSIPERQVAELARQLARVLRGAADAQGAAEVLLVFSPLDAAPVSLEAAARLLETAAVADAAALLARVEQSAPGVRGAEVAGLHARALEGLGRLRGAARRFLRAARLGAAGAPRHEALLFAARVLVRLGRARFARALLDRLGGTAVEPDAAALAAEVSLVTGQAQQAVKACVVLLAGAPPLELSLAVRNTLGKAYLVLGRLDEAQALFAASGELATQGQRPREAALARLNEGVAAFRRGDRERASECWASTPPGHRQAWAQARANLGSLAVEQGDFEAAAEALGQALQAFARAGSVREAALAASNLGRLSHQLGELERAEELSQFALSRARSLGDRYVEAGARLTLGAVTAERRRPVEAAQLLGEAREAYQGLGSDGWAALAAALKARVHLEAGELARAELELTRPCVAAGEPTSLAAALEVALVRGELALALGDLPAVGRAIGRAREVLVERTELEGPWRTALLLSRLKLASGDSLGARDELERAARLLDEVTQRVPLAMRPAFLSAPRRAALLAQLLPATRPTRAVARAAPEGRHGLLGRSPSLERVTRQIDAVGRSSATVLVRGESGTGKELLAEAIHCASPRRHMPLVKVNCAAMVEELLLSELFGHEKGAFTGAVRERKGRFELADGGTIFLDEIGDISPKAQVSLLRVLQEREFERVGGQKTLKVDVRVICATNRNLEALIEEGRFRADLYYRLKGVTLVLPPLRERPEDLELLAHAFLEKAAPAGEAPRTLSAEALALLGRYGWPGNVRELENVMAAAAIFAEGPVITPDAFSHVAELRALHEGLSPAAAAIAAPPVPEARATPLPGDAAALPAALPGGAIDFYELARARGISLKDLRHEVETQCIRRALLDAEGNISEAARLLMMKRSRLSQIVNAEPSLKEVAHGN